MNLKLVLAMLLTFCLIGCIITSVTSPNVSKPILSPNNTTVQVAFQEIRATPYNEQSNNCKDKSEAFAKYLIQNGAKNVALVNVSYKDGTYSHQFIVWNGNAYDPTNNQINVYNMPLQPYLAGLYTIGFTGIVVTSPLN